MDRKMYTKETICHCSNKCNVYCIHNYFSIKNLYDVIFQYATLNTNQNVILMDFIEILHHYSFPLYLNATSLKLYFSVLGLLKQLEKLNLVK